MRRGQGHSGSASQGHLLRSEANKYTSRRAEFLSPPPHRSALSEPCVFVFHRRHHQVYGQWSEGGADTDGNKRANLLNGTQAVAHMAHFCEKLWRQHRFNFSFSPIFNFQSESLQDRGGFESFENYNLFGRTHNWKIFCIIFKYLTVICLFKVKSAMFLHIQRWLSWSFFISSQ